MPSFHVSATFLAIFRSQMQSAFFLYSKTAHSQTYEGWNFNSGNYLFTTDTK